MKATRQGHSDLLGLSGQRVVEIHTRRTNAVGEFRFGAFRYETLHFLPVALIIADALAVRTDGQHPAQSLHLREGLPELHMGNHLA